MGKNKKAFQIVKVLFFSFAGLFIRQSIVFESKPSFSDNTRPVYNELLRRGFGKRYRLVWYLEDNTLAELEGDRVFYLKRKTIKQKIRHYSIIYNTKAIICCNRFLLSNGMEFPIKKKYPKSFYLSHGIPLKSVNSYYTAPEDIDYALSPGKAVTSIMAKEFSINEAKFFVAGYPRNDVFSSTNTRKKLKGYENARIIVWYPTFRQHKNKAVVSKGNAFPLIHDESSIIKLNTIAKDSNTVIFFKPHFAQDTSDFQAMNLSNFVFINDSFFENEKITSYELLSCSDALITDYSSVYYDYTLCDKPIAVVWEDYDEYKEFPGFAIDTDDIMKGAVKVYSIDDLCQFVKDTAIGIDRCKIERHRIRDMANDFADGRNAERAVDFIIEKANL